MVSIEMRRDAFQIVLTETCDGLGVFGETAAFRPASGHLCFLDLHLVRRKRDARGTIPSTRLPPEKFDPTHDQTGRSENTAPLLCQEACNLLVAECRKVVKGETDE